MLWKKSKPFLLIVSGLLLATILSSCGYPLASSYTFVVRNTFQDNLAGTRGPFEPCPSSLEGKITFPALGVVMTSDKVAVGGNYQNKVEHKSKPGDTMIVEGWCYGQDGQELGYVKREFTLPSGTPSRYYEVFVFPPLMLSTDADPVTNRCPRTEERGTKIPCILSS